MLRTARQFNQGYCKLTSSLFKSTRIEAVKIRNPSGFSPSLWEYKHGVSGSSIFSPCTAGVLIDFYPLFKKQNKTARAKESPKPWKNPHSSLMRKCWETETTAFVCLWSSGDVAAFMLSLLHHPYRTPMPLLIHQHSLNNISTFGVDLVCKDWTKIQWAYTHQSQ